MTDQVEELETSALLDGRYQLHERVGAGGMAEVFRAEDILLGRTVAVKLMRSDADVLAAPVRAEREVTALTAVSDPSLVTLFEARIEPGRPRYLVMEYVDGPTLAQRLHEGPMPLNQVRRLALELAAGLHAVHEAGMVHRDIKPSNILLARAPMPSVDFHVKLADFGLAQLTDAAAVTTPGVLLGTAAYLAPEQVRGEVCGPAADIYAFGLVLLEAITGERAYPHASGIGAVIARLVEPPAVPSGLEGPWSDLLLRMTASAAEDRPTALDVIHLLAGPARSTEPATAAHALRRRSQAPVAIPSAPPRPAAVSHRRRGRMSRPALLAASVAAAGVVCASALLTGIAFPANGSEAAQNAPTEQVVPGVLPGTTTTTVAEETLRVDTADASQPQGPAVAGVKASDFPAPASDAKAAEKEARDAQKQQEAAARQAEKDSAAQQRDADKAAREAARAAKKNAP